MLLLGELRELHLGLVDGMQFWGDGARRRDRTHLKQSEVGVEVMPIMHGSQSSEPTLGGLAQRKGSNLIAILRACSGDPDIPRKAKPLSVKTAVAAECQAYKRELQELSSKSVST